MRCFGLRYRKGTRAHEKRPLTNEIKDRFLSTVYKTIVTKKIPAENVFNVDETGIVLVRTGSSGWAPKGLRQVSLLGLGEKREITVTPVASATGTLLFLQVIWEGKTSKVLVNDDDPVSMIVQHHSPSHWQTQETWSSFIKELMARTIT